MKGSDSGVGMSEGSRSVQEEFVSFGWMKYQAPHKPSKNLVFPSKRAGFGM